LTDSNCNKYKGALNDCLNSADYEALRYGHYYDTYKPNLEKLVGWTNISRTNFDEICEYIFFAQYSNINMNFTPSEFDRNYCMAFEEGWIYKTDYGVDYEWKVLSYEFLN